MLYDRDLIAERDSWEKMKSSVVKWWQVNYVNSAAILDSSGQGVISGSIHGTEDMDEEYNAATGSYSGGYGKVVTLDQSGLDQVADILNEKNSFIQQMFQNPNE